MNVGNSGMRTAYLKKQTLIQKKEKLKQKVEEQNNTRTTEKPTQPIETKEPKWGLEA